MKQVKCYSCHLFFDQDKVTGLPVSHGCSITFDRTSKVKEAVRHEVDYLWTELNWDFLKLMAQIAQYAEGKYGRAANYIDSELKRNKSPLNHIPEHLRQYLTGEEHDHWPGDAGKAYHLAAIAYNAMMEYHYFVQRGVPVCEFVREPGEVVTVSEPEAVRPLPLGMINNQDGWGQQLANVPCTVIGTPENPLLPTVDNTPLLSPQAEQSVFAKLAEVLFGKKVPGVGDIMGANITQAPVKVAEQGLHGVPPVTYEKPGQACELVSKTK
jgi:hypothetical protein